MIHAVCNAGEDVRRAEHAVLKGTPRVGA